MDRTNQALPTNKLAVIACTKQKRSTPAQAIDLYDRSPLFRLSVSAARLEGFAVLIFSSKYGLVKPDVILQPYEVDLRQMSSVEHSRWQAAVAEQASTLVAGSGISEVVCFAGNEYRQTLRAVFEPLAVRVSTYPGWQRICTEAFGRGGR